MPREATPLRILPIGDGTLTPERAVEWLEHDVDGLGTLLARGAESCRKKEDGSALAVLAMDFYRMAQACGRALATRKPVTLSREFEPGGLGDFENCTRSLASILAQVSPSEFDGDATTLDVLGGLARELEARITTPKTKGAA